MPACSLLVLLIEICLIGSAMTLRRLIFLLLVVIAVLPSEAQRKARKIDYKANTLTVGKRDGQKFQKLITDVVFTQEETTVYCDSSFYFKRRNIMEAYGHVKILDDSVTITSEELLYYGDTRDAELRKNVIYSKDDQRMLTDFLDYNLDTELAKYFNGGKLLDSTTNTLTSEIGYFYGQQNLATFYTDVTLISPNFTLKADTLRYDTNTKIAYTYGPTEIENEDGTKLFADGGVFRTQVDQSDFVDGKLYTEDYVLEGDQLFFDDLERYYKSIGNVKLTAKNNDVIIIGDEGYYDKTRGISKVFGNPILKRIMEEDTLYMAADTLVAIESEYDSAERILAYKNIRIFKKGMQGLADSAAYFNSDSLFILYQGPILWNESNQINADTISLTIKEENLDRMNLYKNSFMVTEDTLKNYNQIKGRDMVAYFVDDEMTRMTVDGNAEGIYYVLTEGDTSTMGMNKFICSTMKIGFKDSQVSKISIFQQPEAKFIPPHELNVADTKLKGFSWRIDERPSLIDIFRKIPEQNSESSPLKDLPVNPESLAPEQHFRGNRNIPGKGKMIKNVKNEESEDG